MAYYDPMLREIYLSPEERELLGGNSLKGTADRIINSIVWGNPDGYIGKVIKSEKEDAREVPRNACGNK